MEIAQYLLDLAGVLVFLAIAVAPRLISMTSLFDHSKPLV